MATKWIPEAQAAEMVQRKPMTLRKLVKSGKWLIDYRTLNGRSYHYKESDLKRLFDNPESVVKNNQT